MSVDDLGLHTLVVEPPPTLCASHILEIGIGWFLALAIAAPSIGVRHDQVLVCIEERTGVEDCIAGEP